MTLRALVVATLLLGAAPAAASADTVKGTVVARDVARGTIVTAGSGGAVSTLRVARPASFKPGAKVKATAAPQADGTFRASAVKRVGRAKGGAIRGTLIRRSGRELALAAGGSTFALRAARPAGEPGALVYAKLKVAKGKVVAHRIRLTGRATTMQLDGTVAAFDGATLSLAVPGAGTLPIAVPAGAELPVTAGDEAELTVAVAAGFTLLAVDGVLDAYGAVAAVGGGSITVGAVTCAVPEYLDVSDVLVGDVAFLACVWDGALTADELELDEPAFDEEPPVEDDDPSWEDDEEL